MMKGLVKSTRRAIRRARRNQGEDLNLVSMIDVLTVLMFFLLVNQLGISILGVELPGPPVATAEPPPQQDLSVVVRPAGLTLADNGRTLNDFPRQEAGYDFAGLSMKLGELKLATPDDTRISLLLEPSIPYETLVTLMDTVREVPPRGAVGARELFPDISVGVAPPAEAPPPGAADPAAPAAPLDGGAPPVTPAPAAAGDAP